MNKKNSCIIRFVCLIIILCIILPKITIILVNNQKWYIYLSFGLTLFSVILNIIELDKELGQKKE